VLKLIGLSALVWSVRRRSRWRPLDRTRLYEVVEWIGRWSRLQAASVNRRPTR
jgi:paraquat-inducible protein A